MGRGVQEADGEQGHEHQTALERDLQSPEHGHGQYQDPHIPEHSEAGRAKVEGRLVEAVAAGDRVVPEVGDGRALEQVGEQDGDEERDGEGHRYPDEDVEDLVWRDPAVKEQDRRLAER